jgi:hypothetical protein
MHRPCVSCLPHFREGENGTPEGTNRLYATRHSPDWVPSLNSISLKLQYLYLCAHVERATNIAQQLCAC